MEGVDAADGPSQGGSPAGWVPFRFSIQASSDPGEWSGHLRVLFRDYQALLVTPDQQVLSTVSLRFRTANLAVPRALALLANKGSVSVGIPVLECLGPAPHPAAPKTRKRKSTGSQQMDVRDINVWEATVPVQLRSSFFNQRNSDVDTDEGDAVSTLVEYWLGIQEPELGEEEGAGAALMWAFNPRGRIFDLALPSDWQAEVEQPAGLRCHLFRYQRRALSWMLWRESLFISGDGHSYQSHESSADLDSSRSRIDELGQRLLPVLLPGGHQIYYDAVSSSVSKTPSSDVFPQAAGGLLCDEMGLGKTVEIISLILANPPKEKSGVEKFSESGGIAAAQTIDEEIQKQEISSVNQSAVGISTNALSGNTLVVCPPALVQQWHAEVAAHAGPALSVVIYDGLRGFAPPTPVEARLTQAQREAELLARLAAGEAPGSDAANGGTTYSIEREAKEAAAHLAGADVVFTTFDVLRQEVHYSPDNPLLKGLRYAKRYGVPTCPLLQVRWWRLVVDEAQMVGSHSAAGVMMARLHAAHRWCVTGTPIGGDHELEDVRGLLEVIQAQPFADSLAWNRLVRSRLASGRGDLAWDALRRALLPVMWRNTKSVVAEEHALPPRSLRRTRLTFQPGEREFYHQVVQRCRDARDRAIMLRAAEQEKAQTNKLRNSKRARGGGELQLGAINMRGEDDTSNNALQNNSDNHLRGHSSPPVSPRKRAAASSTVSKAEEAVVAGATQLRLACTHPQLTAHWKRLQSDLQLSLGGTLSMEEIMGRLVDKASFEQQNLERSLCACLNTLATVVLENARRGGGSASKRSANNKAAAGGAEKSSPKKEGSGSTLRENLVQSGSKQGDTNGEPMAPHSIDVDTKPGTPSNYTSTGSILAPNADPTSQNVSTSPSQSSALLLPAQREAQHLLEQSFRIAEKGIDAMDVSMDVLKSMPDIEAASTSTVNAWKLLQLNTAAQLEQLYALAGDEARAQAMRTDAADKGNYVRASAELEVAQAKSRLETTREQRAAAQAAALSGCDAARRKGFGTPSWGLDGHTSLQAWLTVVRRELHEAQVREAAELEAQASVVEHMLGTVVEKTLAHLETVLQPRLAALERHINVMKTERAVADLATMLVDARDCGDDAEMLRALCYAAATTLPLLTDYQRRRLVSQWFYLLPGPEVYDPQGTVARRATSRADSQRQLDTPTSEQTHPSNNQTSDGQVIVVNNNTTEDKLSALPASSSKTENATSGATTTGASNFGKKSQCYLGNQTLTEYARICDIIATTTRSVRFQASSQFVGAVSGYVFKLDTQGLGYYRDEPPDADPLHTPLPVRTCLSAISRALTEHLRKQQRAQQGIEDDHVLQRCPLASCETRLEALRSQIQVLRLLKEEHVQEALLRLKNAALGDVDELLAAAARRPPEKKAGADVLRRKITSLRSQAQHLSARRRFMAGRVAEARREHDAERHDDENDKDTVPLGAETGRQHVVAHQECPICYNTIAEGEDVYVFGGCGHSFCRECSAQQVLQSGTCAICRAKVTSKQVFRVAASSSANLHVVETRDPETRAYPTAVPIRGDWSIKITALLRRIIHLAEKMPHEKSLVFSQYPAALDLVGLALSTNGIKHVSLTAGGRGGVRRAIAAFREDEEVKVFLLAHRLGAAGLTLVRANHVFLLEPSLNPAIEQQAVARVHRIGQIRPVMIHRLLVSDTIEEVVLARQEAKASLLVAGADPQDDAEEATTVDMAVTKEVAEKDEVEDLLAAVL